MATRVNIIIDQGTDFSTTVNLTDSAGTNLNLTGFSAASQIRKTHSSSNSTAFTFKGNAVLPLDESVTFSDATVTLNRGTQAAGKTVIGDDVLIMTGVHVAHDCVIGNNVILVNLVALGGHVEIDDWAILGGASNVHQFCKIGKHCMLAANSKIVQDVPPFILAGRHPVEYTGINTLGLKRRGFSQEERTAIKKAYRYYFRSDLNASDSLKTIKNEFKGDKNINEILSFIKNSNRGII